VHDGLVLTVVTGPPCSGKTTYVRQHARPGDIIVDFDAIAQALGSPVSHGHDEQLREVTAAAWAGAVRGAITQRQAGRRAWIVDARPKPYRSERYRQAGARIVHLEAEAAELHRRADAAGRPAVWHQRIDEFVADHDPQPRTVTRW
jgi:AAA domain